MRRFAVRSDQPELMDSEAWGFETFRDCLADLAQVNRLTFAYRPTLQFLDALVARAPPGRPWRILDVGSGYGDMLRRVDAWARARGLEAELVGLDLNPWAARAAREATPADRPIRWVTGHAFDFDEPVDVVISSLLAHHLDDRSLVRLLAWQEARARRGWFVNDLRRAAFPYYGFALLAKAMRWHRFVRHDGPVSIARSFRTADWRRLAADAGLDLDDLDISPRFPFRLCVARVKP
jgi:SAM-dependent methyltransferase